MSDDYDKASSFMWCLMPYLTITTIYEITNSNVIVITNSNTTIYELQIVVIYGWVNSCIKILRTITLYIFSYMWIIYAKWTINKEL